MGKHINISDDETLKKIDQLKSFHNIFQTTKLIKFLVDKDIDNISNTVESNIKETDEDEYNEQDDENENEDNNSNQRKSKKKIKVWDCEDAFK
ncbi:MAG: hypothetical protein PHN31_01785 [Candidatus Gracilibacteria bacterium]|nr:hypothetical protein [Candidatus Gracilibacteria bacterium]